MFLILLTAAANVAIGSHAATNGIIYLTWFSMAFAGMWIAGAAMAHAALSSGACTVLYLWWRSQSPRGGELDLLWEPTFDEAKEAFYTNLWPLLIIGWASGTVWLPLLALVPVAGHLLVSNEIGLGRWLMKQGRSPNGSIFDNHGYHRRVGELFNGLFVIGPAMHILALNTLHQIETLKINWSW